MSNKKTKLSYENLGDLAFDTYCDLNNMMHEFDGIRTLYMMLELDLTKMKEIGRPLTNDQAFVMKSICWSQMSSLFYRLYEYKSIVFQSFNFIPNSFLNYLEVAKSAEFEKLRQIYHHVVDKKTNRIFDVTPTNLIQNKVFIKFRHLLSYQGSQDFFNTLEETKNLFAEHYPDINDRFEKRAIGFTLPRV